MTFDMITMRCLTRLSKKWTAVYILSDSSVREYVYVHLSLCTPLSANPHARECVCHCPGFEFTVNKTLYPFPVGNDCLTIVFLITLWYFSVYVCLLGPAPEGDQHAHSSFCLPQQPVDRERQQQPHHTNPRVVYLHAVCQQVHTKKLKKKKVSPNVWLHLHLNFHLFNPVWGLCICEMFDQLAQIEICIFWDTSGCDGNSGGYLILGAANTPALMLH